MPVTRNWTDTPDRPVTLKEIADKSRDTPFEKTKRQVLHDAKKGAITSLHTHESHKQTWFTYTLDAMHYLFSYCSTHMGRK